MDQRDIVMMAKQIDDLFRFSRAHQAGIDVDADQLIADGLMQQHGRHR